MLVYVVALIEVLLYVATHALCSDTPLFTHTLCKIEAYHVDVAKNDWPAQIENIN